MFIRLFFIAVFMAMTGTAAFAHNWYTGMVNPRTHINCCDGKDCAPVYIHKGEVEELENEFVVHKYGREFRFPKKEAQPSLDGDYHACIWGGPKINGEPDPRFLKPRCFFYPLNT